MKSLKRKKKARVALAVPMKADLPIVESV